MLCVDVDLLVVFLYHINDPSNSSKSVTLTEFNNQGFTLYPYFNKELKMMYNNKFVIAIKVGGRILREIGDSVYIPFGSEYSILAKNLHTERAAVSITIDGQDVLDASRVIVSPLSETEITRSIRNNNLNEGNRFKFIERTASIEEYRGIKVDDGIIVVSFEYERGYVKSTWHKDSYISNTSYRSTAFGDVCALYDANTTTRGPQAMNSTYPGAGTIACSAPGITVAGSISNQQFTTTHFEGNGVVNTIVLKLVGTTADRQPIAAPLTVATKPKCTTCGTVNKATSKFCSNCGTSLQVV